MKLILDFKEIHDDDAGVVVYSVSVNPASKMLSYFDYTKFSAIGDTPIIAAYELFNTLSEEEDVEFNQSPTPEMDIR